MKMISRLALLGVILIAVGYFLFTQWSWVFAKTITGKVQAVDKVTPPVAVFGEPNRQQAAGGMFSFAVAIRQDDGKIVTASSEDRQWAVVQPGICVTATFYPYPPWDLEKGGTFFNARLKEQFDCPK